MVAVVKTSICLSKRKSPIGPHEMVAHMVGGKRASPSDVKNDRNWSSKKKNFKKKSRREKCQQLVKKKNENMVKYMVAARPLPMVKKR